MAGYEHVVAEDVFEDAELRRLYHGTSLGPASCEKSRTPCYEGQQTKLSFQTSGRRFDQVGRTRDNSLFFVGSAKCCRGRTDI